jgi:hypothetical protein
MGVKRTRTGCVGLHRTASTNNVQPYAGRIRLQRFRFAVITEAMTQILMSISRAMSACCQSFKILKRCSRLVREFINLVCAGPPQYINAGRVCQNSIFLELRLLITVAKLLFLKVAVRISTERSRHKTSLTVPEALNGQTQELICPRAHHID